MIPPRKPKPLTPPLYVIFAILIVAVVVGVWAYFAFGPFG